MAEIINHLALALTIQHLLPGLSLAEAARVADLFLAEHQYTEVPESVEATVELLADWLRGAGYALDDVAGRSTTIHPLYRPPEGAGS